MKNNFQSKAVPRGTRTIWRYLGALFLLFTFAIGNVWAQLTPALPATTLTLPNIPTEGWNGTVTPNYYKAAGSNVYVFNPYELYLSVANLTWTTQNSGGNTSPTVAAMAPFPASSVFTGYKAATLNGTSKGPYAYRVTNCVAAYVYCKSGSNNKRTITLAAFEVDGEGNVAASAAESSTYETNSDGVISITLNKDKEYYIKVSQVGSGSGGSSSGNSSFYMIAFQAPYKVTLDPDGGSYPSNTLAGWTYDNVNDKYSKYVTAGSLTLPSAPSKGGYDFTEWQDNKANAYTTSITIDKDTVLTAQWIAAGSAYDVNIASMTNGSVVASPASQVEDGTVTLTVTPDDGYLLSSLSVVGDVSGDEVTVTANQFTMPAEDVTVNATFSLAPTYTVTLNPAGGTIVDATGWTLNAGNYEKEVAEGTVLTLPTFTKTDRAFKTWRKAGPADVASPVTIDGDLSLTAIWTATIEQVIYSWEGAEGGAIETGGTASSSGSNNFINIEKGGYYCFQISGGTSYDNYVEITLSGEEKVKTGDKIKYWGFYHKSSTANARPKMRDGNSPNAEIFNDGTNLPNLYDGTGKPAERTFTVPASINTNKVQITRSQTGSNTWIPKLQIIREVQVEEGDLLTVTFDANGGSAIAPVVVASGQTVAKPADPTKSGYRFKEWQLSGSAYDFSSDVTENITLVADWTQLYAVTYSAGEGSGSMVADAAAEGDKVTLKANGFTAPDSKVFDAWVVTKTVSGVAVEVTAGKFTMPAEAVTVTATWKATYTVNYIDEDGTTPLGSEEVAVGSHPTASEIDAEKDFKILTWLQSSMAVELDEVSAAAGETVELVASYAPAYASSINIEQWVLDNRKNNTAFRALLDAKNYKYANLNDLDSLTAEKNDGDRNEPFLGQKWKLASSEISFLLKSGSTVRTKFGNVGSNVNVVLGDADPVSKGKVDLNAFEYTATADIIVKFQGTGTGTVVFKQIMIDEPIAEVKLPANVTIDANGGTFTGETALKYTGTPLVIADATPADAENYLFDGWYDGETKIDAAAYEPARNVTLVAKYVLKPSPFSLTALTYTIGAGEAQNVGYVEGTYTYTVELPYAGSYENITVAATLKEVSSSIVEGAVMTVTSLPGAATFTVSDGAEGTQLYTINFKKGAKDGVEIIGVVTTGGTNKTVSGLYKGDASVSLANDKKIGNGNYIYVTLAEGYTFEETDVLVVDVKAKSDLPNDPALEITTGVGNIDGSVWKSIANADYELNLVTIPLTGIAANQTSIGLKRSDHQNTWVNGLKVYRPMMPEMTAITINGEDAVKGTGNTFTITLPEEGTDLAALTVVPTIIRNAPHATTPEAVISNEGAWKEGANTYRVMDKDGDYTDYTITITLQGQAPAPVITTQPAGVAYCAGSEPTLTVEATGNELHYAWFKEAGETDEAVGEDAASYTIASAGTYYVVVTNHVDGKLDASVTSANAVVTLNVAAAITTQPTNKRDVVAGSEVTLSVVATNATGYQWYSCEDAEKHGAAAISGAETANYVFNCSANAFYYCVVGNACGADIESNVVSVKLEPVGCNVLDGTIPSAAPYIYDNGEWTLYAVTSGGKLDGTSRFDDDAEDFDGNTVYAITYGRVGMTFAKDVESLTIYATSSSSDRAISSIKVTTDDVTTGTPSYSDVTFTASAEKLGKKDSSSPYRFVLEADNMLLEAGKNYWLQFSGTVSAFKICYSEALAMPVLPTLSNQELCAGAAYEEFDATITNAAACEGTVSYKWYETTDTENPVAETATFTPSAEGTYYVVVTHSAAGHITRTVQSDELSVAHFDALSLVSYSDDVFQHMGTEATLSVVATGKNVAYVWYTCSNAAGDDAVAITPAETESSLTIASVAEGVQYYKVVISHDCDATTLSHVFTVEGWNQLDQVDVTATTTWDMTNVSANHIELTGDDKNARLLLANIDGVNNTTFNAQALKFEGQHIGRTEANVKHLAGRYVQFNVTVPGAVFVTFASNGNNARTIAINGKKCARTTSGTAADKYITYALAVEPGSVEIVGYEGESANQYVRISKIEFKAEYSYRRENLNPNNIGTLCWTNDAVLGGATLYELAGKNEYNKLVFEEVDENRLEAGKPYIFVPENGNTEIKVYNTSDEAVNGPVAHNGMMGTFTNLSTLPAPDGQGDSSPLWNKYIISNNHYVYVDYTNCRLGAYRAYITSLDDVAPANPEPSQNQNGAPRRRIVMGAQSEQVATGCENLNVSDKPVKMIINGQLFILRGEKMYDAKGQLVK